jgi:group I intron endonuclease
MVVYKITNILNGKSYIGQTVQKLDRRLNQHKCKKYADSGKSLISQAIQKYGFNNFTVETLSYCSSYEMMDKHEIKAIQYFNTVSPNGYNLTHGGQSQGKKCEEIVQRIASKNRGKTRSLEVRKNVSEAHKGLVYNSRRKPIKSKCLKTGVVEVFDKLSAVSEVGLNYTAVSRCCYGKRKQYNGRLWTFIDNDFPKNVKINTWTKACIAENLKTGETKIMYTANDMRRLGFNPHNVSHVCNGLKKTHKGWRFRRFGQPYLN